MSKRQAQPMMTELLREALRESDSLRAVARATGVHQPNLSRFLAEKGSLRLDKADALARFFGFRVTRPPRRAKKGGK
ncbi:MAG: helix-turn-helix transcriptional regulator [Planctomycetes bacterium]|nr:helix-turn-helix transcriptional regulator [Planctomycetota bacterium]